MSHSEMVTGPDGWNGWAVHVSEANLPTGIELRPLSGRYAPQSAEMHSFHAVFPLDTPAKIANYWLLIQHLPKEHRGSYDVWLTEAALETVRRQSHPDLPSRLDSIFAFRCGAEAIRFACHWRTGQMAYLYEFQPAAGTVMVDMKIWDNCKWDYAQPANALRILIGMAESYWHGASAGLTAQGMARPELLVPPPVVIPEPAIRFEREK